MPDTDTTLLGGGAQAPAADTQNPPPSPATAPPANQGGYINEDGTFKDGWTDGLPEEFSEAKKSFGKFRNVNDVLKSYHSLETILGKKAGAVTVPTPESKPEEIAAYRKAMGIPDDAKDYAFKPEKLPEGVEWSDEVAATYATIAHKHNIPPAAMRELAEAQIAQEQIRAQSQAGEIQAQIEQGRASLRDEWKGNFDKNIQSAIGVAKSVGLDVQSPGLTDPNVVKALVKLGGMLKEDTLIDGMSPQRVTGRERARMIQTGDTTDATLLHLHKKYASGDEATAKMVREMIQNG